MLYEVGGPKNTPSTMYSGDRKNECKYHFVFNFDVRVIFHPTCGAHRLCVLKESHDHKVKMPKPSKKAAGEQNEDQPLTSEVQRAEDETLHEQTQSNK